MTHKKRKYQLRVSSEFQADLLARWIARSDPANEKVKLTIDPEAKYRAILKIQDIAKYAELFKDVEIVEGYETSEVVEIHEELTQAEPPAAADFIITAMMGSKAADAAIGDLTEVFRKDIDSGMTLTRAKAKYWGEVVFLVGPMLKEFAKRMGLWVLAGKLLG